MPTESNFAFLAEHDPIFVQLATSAERAFSSDPNTTLIKLRQLGEALAQDLAARAGIDLDQTCSQADLLFQLNREIRLDDRIRSLFHSLRIEGNKATHQFTTQHRQAMDGLRIARDLAVWFHRSFGKQGARFKPGPFRTLPDPSLKLRALQTEIDQLSASLSDANQQLDSNQQLTKLVDREKLEYAELAEQMEAEARIYEQLASDAEQTLQQQRWQFEQHLQTLQAQLEAQQTAAPSSGTAPPIQQITQTTQAASAQFSPDEYTTRILIDQQLNAAGWQADTEQLSYKNGARPEKGKNKAIAEWPTIGRQAADYVLFAGLIPIGVIEAKRENTNVAGKIGQAERYAAGFKPTQQMQPAWEKAGRTIAWPDTAEGHYQLPFAYSCNGRPFIKQLAEQSGSWFRDLRDPANLARPLQDFHSPQGLLDRLTRSKAEAEQRLQHEGFAYLKLRDYQIKAIHSVEQALANGQRQCLLAMATGTGKTRTIIGLIYRFLKAERFQRILFLVDRRALGNQALDMFNDTALEQNQTLSKIYNVAELGDMAAAAETRVQVATVQAMVRRIFNPGHPGQPDQSDQSDQAPTIDQYDCIIVDEAHRGYTLDQEMTDGELAIRDQAQYLSSYRRVLDWFDAVRIGLTATPAKHTTEIFGKPVYTYSYREGVADDWLIDHEPPIRYQTLLSQNGIRFDKGEQVSVIDTRSGAVDTTELEDELNFDVSAFNRQVITKGFNQVICQQLAQELDPDGDEKTLIFCATDLHADMVKSLLDQAFKDLHGEQYQQQSVAKITAASDRVDSLIKHYKNERYPSIAITVDLLTTGIDVAKICHLVFLRRVRSRILYEQMIGRATRRCDAIGKTVFNIYDPVDLYAALQDVSTMQPLVKDPKVSIAQLIRELGNPDSFNAPDNQPGNQPGDQAGDQAGNQADKQTGRSHADDILDALSQRIMRITRKAVHKAEQRGDTDPALRQKLSELEQLWGIEPEQLHHHLHQLGATQAAEFLSHHPTLSQQLDDIKQLTGADHPPIIYEGEDQLKSRSQTWGVNEKPADYIDSFSRFIREQINQSAALSVVINRPRDLSREQLKQIRLLLDQHGYSEAQLGSAWRSQTNHEIAASIIGYIRQAAIGEALIPFQQRVETAMTDIYSQHPWTPIQRKWLARLAKQLSHEVIIDHHFVNRAFATDGGAKRLDKVLGRQLDNVLDALAEGLWRDAG